MVRWHNYYLDNHPHFCTSTVAEWRPLLIQETIDTLYDEWERARVTFQVKIFAYVIMPNHFHFIPWAEEGERIKRFLQRTLGETSKKLQPGGGFWKERPRVLPIYSRDVLQTKIDYLHRNPVRAGLVELPDQWEHSSFAQLECGRIGGRFVCDPWHDVVIR